MDNKVKMSSMQSMTVTGGFRTRIKKARALAGFRKYVVEGVNDVVGDCGASACNSGGCSFTPSDQTFDAAGDVAVSRVLGKTLYCCPACKNGECSDC